MTAPDPTTPKEAANWAWNRSVLDQNIEPTSIKASHFKGGPLGFKTKDIIKDQASLLEFREEWAALQKKHGTKVNVPPPPPEKEKTLAEQIYDDMSAQYKTWKNAGCKLATRGAWWGGDGPGKKSGAKAVPSGEIQKVTRLAQTKGWRYTDSRSGEVGWHKSPGNDKPDFIYHAKAPA